MNIFKKLAELMTPKWRITKVETENYLRWYWLPEPEIKTKEDVEARLKRLRLQIKWMKRISKKYSHPKFLTCNQWNININLNEITILK